MAGAGLAVDPLISSARVLPSRAVVLGKDLAGVSAWNDTYGITRIPTMVAGARVARRAGLVDSTGIVYPGSGREDA